MGKRPYFNTASSIRELPIRARVAKYFDRKADLGATLRELGNYCATPVRELLPVLQEMKAEGHVYRTEDCRWWWRRDR